MAKKEWTEEERKAFGEKMKAVRERRQRDAQSTESTSVDAETTQSVSPTATVSSATDVDEESETVSKAEDVDRIAKLEAQIDLLLKMQMAGGGQQVSQNAAEKTKEKYSVNLSLYENPVEALMEWATQDRRMVQQAFAANYELQFVSEVMPRYQLADGSWERQPKFTLGLLEKAYDDDGNQLTRINERGEEVEIKYLRKRLVFFEDPDNALAIAYRKGLQLDDQTSQAFLNDMRYLQAQDWLLEVFYPPKTTTKTGLREEAIAGQMVTIVESPKHFSQIDDSHKLRV